MAIKIYDTEAAYEAATKSMIESTISLIETSNEVKTDGINVLTTSPKKGDIVALNEVNDVVYVTSDSFSAATFPKAWTTVGVVLWRRGNEITIVDKANASKKWSDIYRFKLTGFTLDGTARSGILGVTDASAWGTYTNYTINYNADNMESFVSQLNAYFSANEPFATQGWYAEGNEDGSVNLTLLYSDYRQASNKASGGFAISGNLYPELTPLASIRRKNGYRGGEGAISSWYKALQYLRGDNSSTSYNPNSKVTNIRRNYPICLPAYLGTSQYRDDMCEVLRAYYGEGEQGWLKFMDSCKPLNPSLIGNMAQRDGLSLTRQLASYTYKDKSGIVKPASQAADYVSQKNYEHDGLRKGDWAMPTVEDLANILEDIKYSAASSDRNSDVVNKSLLKIGGNAISNSSSYWPCCRNSAGSPWGSSGNGFFGSYSMNYAYVVLGVARLALK